MKAAIKAVAESLPVLVIHGDVSTTKLVGEPAEEQCVPMVLWF